MTTSSNCTQRRKRGISLSSRLSDNDNPKDIRQHHTTIQSSFIREPRPSSLSYVFQRPLTIKTQDFISVPKIIPNKITFRYTNKSQNFTPQIYHQIEPINNQHQIRYLIGPQSSRIRVLNNESMDQTSLQEINPKIDLSNRFSIAQSNYVSPYKNLITPLKFENSAKTNNRYNPSQQFVLPLNSELSKIKQFKMEQESYCKVQAQTKNLNKSTIKQQSQLIGNVNVNLNFVETNPIRYVNDLTEGNPQINQKISEEGVLKEKTWKNNNINNQSTKQTQKVSNKKSEKTKGRMNHLRIKEVQKRLEQIIKVCDNNLY